jgi:hypothetical protein
MISVRITSSHVTCNWRNHGCCCILCVDFAASYSTIYICLFNSFKFSYTVPYLQYALYYISCRFPSSWDWNFPIINRSCRVITGLPVCTAVKTPWPLVRNRTIPTERPPLVGEVSANFCGYRVSHGQRNGSPRPLIRFSWPEPLLFHSSSSSVMCTAITVRKVTELLPENILWLLPPPVYCGHLLSRRIALRSGLGAH